MDQSIGLSTGDRRRAVEDSQPVRRVSRSSSAARATRRSTTWCSTASFPTTSIPPCSPPCRWRPTTARCPGRSKGHDLTDGTHTRVKIDLFPEYIRALPPEKRAVWDVVGRALCSETVKRAFVRRLAPGLRRRFGADFAKVGMYPIPILTRDIPGYQITPHPDTHWKGITVQLYLPRDDATSHIGTIFHERLPDGSMPKRTQMKFAPNTGYAFAVGEDTWHSADTVGPEVKTRDSILLTYFVDPGCCASCAIAASGSAISSSTRSATGCGAEARANSALGDTRLKRVLTPRGHVVPHGHPQTAPHRPHRARALHRRGAADRLFRRQRLYRQPRPPGQAGPRPADRAAHAASSPPSRPSARRGSGGSRCSSRTASIPTCWTSARGRCSTTSIRAT